MSELRSELLERARAVLADSGYKERRFWGRYEEVTPAAAWTAIEVAQPSFRWPCYSCFMATVTWLLPERHIASLDFAAYVKPMGVWADCVDGKCHYPDEPRRPPKTSLRNTWSLG